VLLDISEVLRLNPMLFVLIFAVSFVLFFVLGILFGNVTAMKLLTWLGLPILSGKIAKDFRVASSLNRDVVGWLKIPDTCYAPVMLYTEGFYKTHNFMKRENEHGELHLSGGRNSLDLRGIANKSDNLFSDLSLIIGSASVRSTSARNAQLTCVRKYILTDLKKHNPDIFIIDKGRLRVFTLLFATEMGLDNQKSLSFSSRESFIRGMRDISYFDTFKPSTNDILILSGSTDIDTMLVFLVEKEV
jgi:hypothetical protein